MRAHRHTGGGNMSSNNHESRITRLEVTQENISQALIDIKSTLVSLDNKIDNKFDTLDGKISNLDKKFDTKFDSLNNRLWTNFFWMIGGFASVLGIVAHALHWV
jgi:hypothetical protein